MVCSGVSKSAGFIFPLAHGDSSSFLCLEPRNSRKLKSKKGTIFADWDVEESSRDSVSESRCYATKVLRFPPFFPRVSLGYPARFSGDTQQTAPCDSRRRWTRCVKFSWGETRVIQPHRCAVQAALPCCLFKDSKIRRERGGKTKDTTLKYQQKRACVQMIIKGCLTPSPPAPSADLKSTICSRELLSASWKRLF